MGIDKCQSHNQRRLKHSSGACTQQYYTYVRSIQTVGKLQYNSHTTQVFPMQHKTWFVQCRRRYKPAIAHTEESSCNLCEG